MTDVTLTDGPLAAPVSSTKTTRYVEYGGGHPTVAKRKYALFVKFPPTNWLLNMARASI